MIEDIKDYDEQFFRMVTIGLAKTLSKNIRWINYFSDKRIRVFLPFYTSLTGDERFVFDAFVDDIPDKRVTLNTDQLQRGSITFTNTNSKSDEFANPNQYLSKKTNINGTIRKVITKVKAVPISLNYEIDIQLATENEVSKCLSKIYNVLFNYYFFNFDYFGLKIDANFLLPDDKPIENPREITMDSETKKHIKFSLEVKTYYPIFQIDTDDLIVCDNDNDINWDELEIPQPSNNYIDSLKKYNLAFNRKSYSGVTIESEDGISINTVVEGTTEIKKVYWENYYLTIDSLPYKYKYDSTDPKKWKKENFIINPGKSKKDKNID
jgi:hypothetical protein